VIGRGFVTVAMLSKASKVIQVVIEAARAMPNRSGARSVAL